ncbi:MAG: hypothetical protein J5486_06910 [Bacteroidaceae bacterium]|nr:hypothetical protein [Bacteroidaceae bacterium]
MLRFLCILSFVLLPVFSFAENEKLLNELDVAINNRQVYIKAKKSKIHLLQTEMLAQTDSDAMLNTLNQLYTEYYVFQFDSAMAIAKKGLLLAEQYGNQRFISLFKINLAEILSMGGLYLEAQDCLENIDTISLSRQMLYQYYLASYHVFSYSASYTHDTPYSGRYWQKALENLSKSMYYLDVDDPDYDYYKGEFYAYVKADTAKARQHYQNVVANGNFNSRTIAMSCYALAFYYQNTRHDKKLYEQYLIQSALSDIQSCTMETVAMKMLATLLFEKGQDYVERAEIYINQSMSDAEFYNNRLRMIESSHIMPEITNAYQTKIQRQNRFLRYALVLISLLLMGLLFTAVRIHRQKHKISIGRKILADNYQQLSVLNRQLAESNEQQMVMNQQLSELNEKLFNTNKRREALALIYIDLCAKYIDKLGKYQILVKRRIKANQAQELLQTMSSTRISEEDAGIFLSRFDKAFLELYPTFVKEFNALLPEEVRIWPKTPSTLTTELRTFALIRLGVKNTADIAGLLFLSTQTIYNCRSVIKNKALNKESFDDDVRKLCTVVS